MFTHCVQHISTTFGTYLCKSLVAEVVIHRKSVGLGLQQLDVESQRSINGRS
jgi:hypothetical protein